MRTHCPGVLEEAGLRKPESGEKKFRKVLDKCKGAVVYCITVKTKASWRNLRGAFFYLLRVRSVRKFIKERISESEG